MSESKGTQSYHDRITELFDGYYSAEADDKPTSKRRVEDADSLVEQYYRQTGKRPPASVLSRLATYILLDTLTDSHPDKMTREEYPIMSYGQTGRHFERNTPKPDLTYGEGTERGRVKRPFITEDGAVWVANGVIIEKEVEELGGADWRVFLRELLTEREAYILEQAYGECATQAEIAERLGVSRQRVGVIMSQAFDKIREIITR